MPDCWCCATTCRFVWRAPRRHLPRFSARDREGVAPAVRGAAAARDGAHLRRRPFLRRPADRNGRRRASRDSPTGCCCSLIRCIRRGSRINCAPHFSRSCAPPRSSSTARAIPSAASRNCARRSPRFQHAPRSWSVERSGHDLKHGSTPGRGDSGPHAILKNNSPKGMLYARIPLYDSPRDPGHPHRFEDQFPEGAARTFSAIWTITVGSIFPRDTSIPGRYSRWDIASTCPPLEIISCDRRFEFRPLNARGREIVAALPSACWRTIRTGTSSASKARCSPAV